MNARESLGENIPLLEPQAERRPSFKSTTRNAVTRRPPPTHAGNASNATAGKAFRSLFTMARDAVTLGIAMVDLRYRRTVHFFVIQLPPTVFQPARNGSSPLPISLPTA